MENLTMKDLRFVLVIFLGSIAAVFVSLFFCGGSAAVEIALCTVIICVVMAICTCRITCKYGNPEDQPSAPSTPEEPEEPFLRHYTDC